MKKEKWIALLALAFGVSANATELVYYPAEITPPTEETVGKFSASAPTEFMADFFDMPEFYPSTSAPSFGDSIDPLSQMLRIVHTDAVLKVNGGLDVSITRFYRHIHDSTFRNDYDDRSKYNNLNSPLGLGWQMHYGRVMYSKPISNPCATQYHFNFETQAGDLQQFFWK